MIKILLAPLGSSFMDNGEKCNLGQGDFPAPNVCC